ncbi:hypothetical protein GPK34_00925 [Secundilactobacillus kimchicus]|uniref:hypothetical protein n=1 Tax=Secundilactobacillus kimchicus TaxID=528209 RepID=UPI001C00DFA4|nr:hypothetical protein [Secundilactobacillus kimchicus]MBT9670601.1 hypothetical protein [Secundilactobacillus kimchicus]
MSFQFDFDQPMKELSEQEKKENREKYGVDGLQNIFDNYGTMTTKMFIDILESMGFSVSRYSLGNDDTDYYVYEKTERNFKVFSFRPDWRFGIDTCCRAFNELDEYTQDKLIKAIHAYTDTPVKDRKEMPTFKVNLGIKIEGLQQSYVSVCNNGEIVLQLESLADVFIPSMWDKVRGNLPAFNEDNPIFEMINRGVEND